MSQQKLPDWKDWLIGFLLDIIVTVSFVYIYRKYPDLAMGYIAFMILRLRSELGI